MVVVRSAHMVRIAYRNKSVFLKYRIERSMPTLNQVCDVIVQPPIAYTTSKNERFELQSTNSNVQPISRIGHQQTLPGANRKDLYGAKHDVEPNRPAAVTRHIIESKFMGVPRKEV
ncbi:hypothetical protein Trydic_g6279 [Trypoxylus dichotomus]